METRDLIRHLMRDDHRGGRQHRFMEAADINAAFREFFEPLRTYIRRGMRTDGQVYSIEMDTCLPGELLGADWIPLASRGIADPAVLADPARRRALFDQLLSETRAEAMFAYVCERHDGPGGARLHVEIVSVDGCHAADYPIVPGAGWHRRDLQDAPHRRIDARALA